MSAEPPERPIGPAFARSVARFSGCVGELDDDAASELSLILEHRLRTTVALAQKLARRARRRSLSCADIRDAGRVDGCSDATSEPWAEILARVPGAGRRSILRFDDSRGSASSETPAPVDFGLRVEWVAVSGAILVGRECPLTPHGGTGACSSSSTSRFAGRGPHSASDDVARLLGGGPLDAALPLLSEEQLAALRRVVDVLCCGEDAPHWQSTAVALSGKEQFAAMRPFLAHILAKQVPSRIMHASPCEMLPLLHALEVLVLDTPMGGPQGAELYIHQCLPPLFLLCLSPALGLHYKGGLDRMPTEVGYGAIRRTAAVLISSAAHRYADAIPELYAEVCLTFERALRGRPSLAATAGALQGLTALGPASVRHVLLPLLFEGGLLDHIVGCACGEPGNQTATKRPDAGSCGGSDAKPGGGALEDDLFVDLNGDRGASRPPRKKPRIKQHASASGEEGRAEAFRALVDAAMTIASPGAQGACIVAGAGGSARVSTARHLAGGGQVRERTGPGGMIWRAAQLCEVAAAAFGVDAAPLLASLPAETVAGITPPAVAAAPTPAAPSKKNAVSGSGLTSAKAVAQAYRQQTELALQGRRDGASSHGGRSFKNLLGSLML